MKIADLIELLQEEQEIHPHAEVVVDTETGEYDPIGIDFDGQSLHIHPAP